MPSYLRCSLPKRHRRTATLLLACAALTATAQPTLAIPSPELVVGSLSSLSQLTALLSAIFGGGALAFGSRLAKGRKGAADTRRMGPQTACRAAATWPEEIAVSVNLSAAQFRVPNIDNDDAIEQIVRDALSGANLAPARLQLEVTETLLLHDKSETWAALGKLKALGISIALDDFGTGYSSLSYLRRFPFDKIKIDKSFVRDIGEHSDSITIVQAISDLASTLGMACVAEGVETEEQLRLLETVRCEEMQGFLFSSPFQPTWFWRHCTRAGP